ncbi:MAG: hypothetical protein IPJ74_16300 [Saprospiraceae bacterium]|nr:hypothetical protein [Saprospiraceae bacterium]
MKSIFLLSLLSLWASFSCAATSIFKDKGEPELEYVIERHDSNSLLIKITFFGNQKGNTLLHLPNEWAGQQKLYQAITELTAISVHTTIFSTENPSEYRVKFPANSKVILSYVLTKDWDGPLQYPMYFRPIIVPDYFYFEGYSGLVYPDMENEENFRCKISYKGFSQKDFFGNSYFSLSESQTFPTNIQDLLNSFFCAGDFRSKEIKTESGKVVIALRGKFNFEDEEAFTMISNIIQAERKFWNDPGVPYFFVTVFPMDDQGNSGGTAHQNSFVLFQSKNLKLTEGLTYLISHEYFHTWIGQNLKMPEPEEVYKWFSEGFTDYYSYKILYSLNIITETAFLQKLNQLIWEYYLSPHFQLDNKDLVGRYWESNALKDLSYRRGLLIAFALENKISEQQSSSLDALLKTLYDKSAPSMIFSKQTFDTLVLQFIDSITLAAINNALEGKNDSLTNILINSKAYKIQLQRIDKVFDLGFNFAASQKAKKIVGLKKGSNAETAGLIEGMDITNGFSIWNNNTEKPAKVQVIRNGIKEWIEYFPVAESNIQVPQIIIKE